MASEAKGGRVGFEEMQQPEPLLLWGIGSLVAVCALPLVALTALFLATGGAAVSGTVLALTAIVPAFGLLVFYAPLRARRIHTTVTDDAFAVEMYGLLFARETRVPLDAVTRVVCWEEFGRLRALVAGFSGEEMTENADRIREFGDANGGPRGMAQDTFLLRYRSASPNRTYAGLIRIDHRDGPPVYVNSSRAVELTDAILRGAETGRDA